MERRRAERPASTLTKSSVLTIVNFVAWIPIAISTQNAELARNKVSRSFGLPPKAIHRVIVRGGYQSSSTDESDEYFDEVDAFRVASVVEFGDGADIRLGFVDGNLSIISAGTDAEEEEKEEETKQTADLTAQEPSVASAPENDDDVTIPEGKDQLDLNSLVFGAARPGDGSESDPDGIPSRFLRMQKGNRQHAKDAFISTVQWRLENKVDAILSRAHPTFDICKAIFYHYFPGRDPQGNPIIVQRPGMLDLELAHKLNISMDDLLLHYVYVLEYCWNILEPGPPDGVMTSVVDMTGVGFRQICNAEMRDFIQKSIGVISENYPQRSYRTLVINAPGWFGRLFKMIKPILRESTRNKIEIHNPGPAQNKALEKHLGQESLPAELLVGDVEVPKGSDLEFEPGPKSRIEHELREFTLSVLDARDEQMLPVPSSG